MCEALDAAGRAEEAVRCFHEMMKASGGETNVHGGEVLEWMQSESVMRLAVSLLM